MRRLPIYLLLDTSGSMANEPIEAVKNGLKAMLASLRQDPHALETAFLSVIEFNSDARQVVPLTDLISFVEPDLTVSGATSLGKALEVLAECLEREVVRSTSETKGDWAPLVFLFTDGHATDTMDKGIQALKAQKTGIVVACAAGQHAKPEELQRITETVVRLDTADASTIAAFFKWVSASISVSSQKVETGNGETSKLDELPAPPAEISLIDLSKH